MLVLKICICWIEGSEPEWKLLRLYNTGFFTEKLLNSWIEWKIMYWMRLLLQPQFWGPLELSSTYISAGEG
jgi:hypothetical protein